MDLPHLYRERLVYHVGAQQRYNQPTTYQQLDHTLWSQEATLAVYSIQK